MERSQQVPQGQSLIIYTKEGCPTCVRAKAYYKRNQLPFEERDVYQKDEWRLEATKLSPNATVPIIIADGIVTVGWEGREG